MTKSAYYDWRGRGAAVTGAEAFALCARMKTLFAQSRQSLGSRGRVRQLRQERYVLGRYRVRRLMKRIGDQVYTTREAAILDMHEYMKYYGGVRLHSTLGYRTLMEYENGFGRVSGLG